jgi:hypothetical protein
VRHGQSRRPGWEAGERTQNLTTGTLTSPDAISDRPSLPPASLLRPFVSVPLLRPPPSSTCSVPLHCHLCAFVLSFCSPQRNGNSHARPSRQPLFSASHRFGVHSLNAMEHTQPVRNECRKQAWTPLLLRQDNPIPKPLASRLLRLPPPVPLGRFFLSPSVPRRRAPAAPRFGRRHKSRRFPILARLPHHHHHVPLDSLDPPESSLAAIQRVAFLPYLSIRVY